MKTHIAILLGLLALAVSGCSSLPYATRNSFEIGGARIVTSRDSVIKGLKVQSPDGLQISLDEYTATANAEALEAAKAEAQYRAAALGVSRDTTEALVKALAAAATAKQPVEVAK